ALGRTPPARSAPAGLLIRPGTLLVQLGQIRRDRAMIENGAAELRACRGDLHERDVSRSVLLANLSTADAWLTSYPVGDPSMPGRSFADTAREATPAPGQGPSQRASIEGHATLMRALEVAASEDVTRIAPMIEELRDA